MTRRRPLPILILSAFFAVGAVISFTSSISLIFPNSFLDPMWRLNPRAHASLTSLGMWVVVLMFAVSVSCAAAAIGLCRGSQWGRRVAVCQFPRPRFQNCARTPLSGPHSYLSVVGRLEHWPTAIRLTILRACAVSLRAAIWASLQGTCLASSNIAVNPYVGFPTELL